MGENYLKVVMEMRWMRLNAIDIHTTAAHSVNVYNDTYSNVVPVPISSFPGDHLHHTGLSPDSRQYRYAMIERAKGVQAPSSSQQIF